MIDTNEHSTSTSDFDSRESYTIEQVAAQTGLTKRTLRYYEEVGLLPPTDRTEGNYRRYSHDDVQRLEHIKNLRDLLGFSLADIREIMEVEDERGILREAFQHATEAAAKIAQLDQANALIRKQLHLIEQKIAGLQQMQNALAQQIAKHERTREQLQEQV